MLSGGEGLVFRAPSSRLCKVLALFSQGTKFKGSEIELGSSEGPSSRTVLARANSKLELQAKLRRSPQLVGAMTKVLTRKVL